MNAFSRASVDESGEVVIGEGVGFDRIRRITGYLVGTMDRWNDAKTAEERDRVKHMSSTSNGGKSIE